MAPSSTQVLMVRMLAPSLAGKKCVSDLCNDLFRDYQFGLNLIKTNTGRIEFVIPAAALAAPDKFLSDWVAGSYRVPGQP